jgi:hypothetical protein
VLVVISFHLTLTTLRWRLFFYYFSHDSLVIRQKYPTMQIDGEDESLE